MTHIYRLVLPFTFYKYNGMESISWTDCTKKEEVLNKGQGEGEYSKNSKRGKASLICHILNWNCFLKQLTEGKIERRTEVTRRRGRRDKQILDGLKEKREN